MEKFGVETDEGSKLASQGDKQQCPNCRAAIEPSETSNVAKCPRCGTKPFEKR